MNIGAWIWVVLFAVGVLLFYCYSRAGRFLRCLLFTALTGWAGLGIVWLAGNFLQLGIAVTPLSIGISGLLGVPGVVLMLLLNLL